MEAHVAGLSMEVANSLKPPFDETALAQLGAAVVLLWRDLPEEMREQLLDAAELVGRIRSVRDVRSRLDELIARQASQDLSS